MNSFEAFKGGNNERLDDIEKCMSADVVTTDKVERISRGARCDGVEEGGAAAARPANAPWLIGLEYKQALEIYVRHGDHRLLRALDTEAMSMAPARTVDTWRRGETEAEIGKQLAALSPIRLIAAVRQFQARC